MSWEHLRHQNGRECEEEEADGEDKTREAGCEPADGREKRGEECEDVEDQANEVEDPAESPHVVVVFAGSVVSKGATSFR